MILKTKLNNKHENKSDLDNIYLFITKNFGLK